MGKFVVVVPYRGERYYLVDAASKAAAMRKAEDGEGDDVEALDFRVTRYHRPSDAWPDAQHRGDSRGGEG